MPTTDPDMRIVFFRVPVTVEVPELCPSIRETGAPNLPDAVLVVANEPWRLPLADRMAV